MSKLDIVPSRERCLERYTNVTDDRKENDLRVRPYSG